MPDDFKLSIDIEANLNKLDQSLNMATQKVQTAGRRMQSDLFGAGLGGSTFTGISPMAQQAASGHVSGMAASFGGGANIAYGNANNINAMNLAAAQYASRNASFDREQRLRQLFGPQQTFMGGLESLAGRFGVSAASPMAITAGIGAAGIAGANYALPLMIQAGQIQQAGNIIRGVSGTGPYAAGEQFRQLQTILQNVQAPGGLRFIPGVNQALRSAIEYRSYQTTGHGTNLGMAAQIADERAGFQRETAVGFGGYTGELENLRFDRAQLATRVESVRAQLGSAAANAFQADANRAFDQRAANIARDRTIDLLTIRNQTTQSTLNAFGAPVLSRLVGIRTQFQSERLKTNPLDFQRLTALSRAESAANLEAITSGTQPAQEFIPGTTAFGADRVSGLRGQAPETLRVLRQIAGSLDADRITSLVGRN